MKEFKVVDTFHGFQVRELGSQHSVGTYVAGPYKSRQVADTVRDALATAEAVDRKVVEFNIPDLKPGEEIAAESQVNNEYVVTFRRPTVPYHRAILVQSGRDGNWEAFSFEKQETKLRVGGMFYWTPQFGPSCGVMVGGLSTKADPK